MLTVILKIIKKYIKYGNHIKNHIIIDKSGNQTLEIEPIIVNIPEIRDMNDNKIIAGIHPNNIVTDEVVLSALCNLFNIFS